MVWERRRVGVRPDQVPGGQANQALVGSSAAQGGMWAQMRPVVRNDRNRVPRRKAAPNTAMRSSVTTGFANAQPACDRFGSQTAHRAPLRMHAWS